MVVGFRCLRCVEMWQQMDFSKHHFFIVNNPRLAFENAGATVSSFIEKRLKYNSVLSYEFLDIINNLDASLEGLLQDSDCNIDYIVIADIMNPFCDMELVCEMTEVLKRTNKQYCVCEGAIPGTEVTGVVSVASLVSGLSFKLSNYAKDRQEVALLRWNSQQKHNNQLNLYKYKRLKLFLALEKKHNSMHEQTIDQLIENLSTDEMFLILACFGEEVRLLFHEQCPYCYGKLHPLTNSMSQPFCGYLPSARSLYHECESCGLVILSPFIHEDDVSKIYDKWDKEDFVVSTNNPYTAKSIRCDFSSVISFLPKATRSLDIGGGIGNFSKFLFEQYPEWNVTHSDFEIKANISENINSRVLDFTKDQIGNERYDIVTAWEVIEHVPFHMLSDVLHNVWQALTPGGFFVFSTPDFDSPLCRSFDFYALCPPFHYVVYGEKWLKRYFADSNEFEIFDSKHCSDFLDDAFDWYGYGSSTCPSMSLQNNSAVMQTIFEFDQDHSLRNKLTRVGMGTEIILTLRKKTL